MKRTYTTPNEYQTRMRSNRVVSNYLNTMTSWVIFKCDGEKGGEAGVNVCLRVKSFYAQIFLYATTYRILFH